MFRSILIVALFAAVALPAAAQDYPKFELGAGYSYVRANITAKDQTVTPSVSASKGFNLQGGGGNIAYNFTHNLGIVADFAGYDVTGLPKGTGTSATLFTYMFGPRFTYRENETFQPFAHALFGGAPISGSGSVPALSAVSSRATISEFSGTSDAFAMAIGGGLDVKIAKHIALRVFEGDYLLTRFKTTLNSSGKLTAANQNNFRLVAGVQFRF
jgi:hypothetical protein